MFDAPLTADVLLALATLTATMYQAYAGDPDVVAAKGAAGARTVSERFTGRHVGDQVERCLREVTGNA